MKAELIKVGETYAVPYSALSGWPSHSSGRRGYRYSSGTKNDVTTGSKAAPAKVVAVGKFRVRRSGACATEIVEDNHTTTVKVLVPDLKAMGVANGYDKDGNRVALPGSVAGLPVTSKKIAWVEAVIELQHVMMPWDSFLQRRDEKLFAQQERAAFEERKRIVERAITELLSTTARKIVTRDTNLMLSVEHRHDQWNNKNRRYETTYRVVSAALPEARVISALTNAEKKQLDQLVSERDLLEKKLSCAL